jgi:hypothetical protein
MRYQLMSEPEPFCRGSNLNLGDRSPTARLLGVMTITDLSHCWDGTKLRPECADINPEYNIGRTTANIRSHIRTGGALFPYDTTLVIHAGSRILVDYPRIITTQAYVEKHERIGLFPRLLPPKTTFQQSGGRSDYINHTRYLNYTTGFTTGADQWAIVSSERV